MIEGGATIWARKTIDSDIFLKKPDKWFKIWFYLVNKVSHKENERYKIGETFVYYEWISEATGATPDQVKKCMSWLRKCNMVSTRRSTRGVWIKVLNYKQYQDLKSYSNKKEAPAKALEKHQRSTREAPRYYKNDNNDKYIINTGAKAPDLKEKQKNQLFNKRVLEYPIQEIFDFIQERHKPGIVGRLRQANKKNPSVLLKAYLEAKELKKPYINYIFKIYNNLLKKV